MQKKYVFKIEIFVKDYEVDTLFLNFTLLFQELSCRVWYP